MPTDHPPLLQPRHRSRWKTVVAAAVLASGSLPTAAVPPTAAMAPVAAVTVPADADEPAAPRGADSVDGRSIAEPIEVELPAAPPPLARWIDLGQVEFEFYDPQRERFDFAAETRFRFHYSYRCQTRWQLIEGPDKPSALLEIRPVYEEVELAVSHRVRLPIAVGGAAFFDHPLVRHEFDHIAISADPALPARLARLLKRRNDIILEPIPPAILKEKHNPATGRLQQQLGEMASAVVRRESDQVFEQFMQAVAIRYRELDRVTSHGLRPLGSGDRTRLIDSPGPEPPVETFIPEPLTADDPVADEATAELATESEG